MPAPTSCSVCEHPEREWIDVALKGGSSLRGIEKTFGIGRTALTNHAGRHTTAIETRRFREAARGGRRRKAKMAARSDLRPIESAGDVIEDLQRLRVEAYTLFEDAKTRADWKQAQMLFGQLVQIVDRFGEMYKVLGPKGAMNLTVDGSTKIVNLVARMSDEELRAIVSADSACQALPAAGETIDVK